MIESVKGRCNEDGRWIAGHMIRSRNEEKYMFYCGYATALMEFNNSVYDFIKAKERTLKEEEEEEENKNAPMVGPLELNFGFGNGNGNENENE